MEYGGYLSLLIIFYCVGAYIRIYPYSFLSKKKNALIIFIISFSLLILSSVSIDFLGEKISYFHGMAQKFYSIHSVLVLVIAASMLSLFANMKPFYSKTINTVAGCTFGVYLIHENEFIRKLLWKELFDNSSYAQSKYLILHFIVSALIVYICCTLIELIRKVLLDKYVFKKLSDAISNLINKFLIKIQQIKGN
jgi:hypothetical protein